MRNINLRQLHASVRIYKNKYVGYKRGQMRPRAQFLKPPHVMGAEKLVHGLMLSWHEQKQNVEASLHLCIYHSIYLTILSCCPLCVLHILSSLHRANCQTVADKHSSYSHMHVQPKKLFFILEWFGFDSTF